MGQFNDSQGTSKRGIHTYLSFSMFSSASHGHQLSMRDTQMNLLLYIQTINADIIIIIIGKSVRENILNHERLLQK
jgi:hypothetical protein